MKVTFTKVDGKRYTVTIDREAGPPLVTRYAPGYDDLMPHDLAHYLVEEQHEISLGVWGQLAAGGGGIFTPAPEDNTLAVKRRAQRIAAMGREDMQRSEALVGITVRAWERSINRVKHQVRPHAVEVDAEALRRAVSRMAEVAHRWGVLRPGRSLDFEWPERLTFDPSTSRRGRRSRRAAVARRYRGDARSSG